MQNRLARERPDPDWDARQLFYALIGWGIPAASWCVCVSLVDFGDGDRTAWPPLPMVESRLAAQLFLGAVLVGLCALAAFILRGPASRPRASITAGLIVGVVPALAWLYAAARLVVATRDLLPWVGAGLLVFLLLALRLSPALWRARARWRRSWIDDGREALSARRYAWLAGYGFPLAPIFAVVACVFWPGLANAADPFVSAPEAAITLVLLAVAIEAFSVLWWRRELDLAAERGPDARRRVAILPLRGKVVGVAVFLVGLFIFVFQANWFVSVFSSIYLLYALSVTFAPALLGVACACALREVRDARRRRASDLS